MADPPTISLSLPRPPSTNRLHYQPPGFKRRIRTPEYAAWLTEAGWEARRQLVGVKTIEGLFRVLITVPATSTRDENNWDKALIDLLPRVGAVNDDAGLRGGCPIARGDRADCLVEIWDIGGPPVRRRTVYHATKPRSTQTPAAKLAAAHRYWNKLR